MTKTMNKRDLTTIAKIANSVRVRSRRIVTDMIELGKDIRRARDKFDAYGMREEWRLWVIQECHLTLEYAAKVVRVAEAFPKGHPSGTNVTVPVLDLLCTPTIPEAAKQEIETNLNDGVHLSMQKATAIVDKHVTDYPTEEEETTVNAVIAFQKCISIMAEKVAPHIKPADLLRLSDVMFTYDEAHVANVRVVNALWSGFYVKWSKRPIARNKGRSITNLHRSRRERAREAFRILRSYEPSIH